MELGKKPFTSKSNVYYILEILFKPDSRVNIAMSLDAQLRFLGRKYKTLISRRLWKESPIFQFNPFQIAFCWLWSKPEGEGISAGVIKCSWLLTLSCVARSSCARHSSLYKPLIFSPGPRLWTRDPGDVTLSRRVGPSHWERDTWPVAVTSVSPRPEIRSELRTAEWDLLWFFGKERSRRFVLCCFFPGRSREDVTQS